MSNKIVDKRDLVLNQAKEILLNMLKDHADNEFCNYVYLELTLGEDIEQCYINRIKNDILRVDGAFKIKKNEPRNRKGGRYSMDDLLDSLIHYLSIGLRDKVLVNRAEEIIGKYGTIVYLDGIERCLKETLLGMKERYFNKYYNDFEKMIEEYILRA